MPFNDYFCFEIRCLWPQVDPLAGFDRSGQQLGT